MVAIFVSTSDIRDFINRLPPLSIHGLLYSLLHVRSSSLLLFTVYFYTCVFSSWLVIQVSSFIKSTRLVVSLCSASCSLPTPSRPPPSTPNTTTYDSWAETWLSHCWSTVFLRVPPNCNESFATDLHNDWGIGDQITSTDPVAGEYNFPFNLPLRLGIQEGKGRRSRTLWLHQQHLIAKVFSVLVLLIE